MPTVVLQDTAGVDLGFLLISGHQSLGEGPPGRDVVLMKLPLPSTSPLARFLETNRHQEFTACVQPTTSGSVLTFAADSEVLVRIEVGNDGAGTWSAGDVGTGLCRLAPPKNQ